MSEFDDAHAFVDGFFAALATRAPQSASLESSHDVVVSCLRLGQSISQAQNPNRAATITLASVALAASITNHVNASNGSAYRSHPSMGSDPMEVRKEKMIDSRVEHVERVEGECGIICSI